MTATLAARNAHLDHAHAQLVTYLGVFPDERRELGALIAQITDGDADLLLRGNMRGHITTSGLVCDESVGKVLMIHHRGLDRWLQPGGHHEGTDDLELSAAREVLEETGMDSLVNHPWHQTNKAPFDVETHRIAASPAKGEGEHWHHDFIYLFVSASCRPLRPQMAEVKDARWMELSEFEALPEGRFARIARKLRGLPSLRASD